MICPNCSEYTSARYVRCPHCGTLQKPPEAEETPKPVPPMPTTGMEPGTYGGFGDAYRDGGLAARE